MIVNGWGLYCSPVFYAILDKLIEDVIRRKEREPDGYVQTAQAKHLKRIYKIISNDVPESPSDVRFELGNTLGAKYRSWRRVKFNRHRLFFKFSSDRSNVVYAWVNDDSCLRQKGGKNDPYRVFKTMLRKSEIDNDYDLLLATSKNLERPPTGL